jgi:hypothetical protein
MAVVGPVPGEERDSEVRVGVPERGDGGGEARVGEHDQVGSVERAASTHVREATRRGR